MSGILDWISVNWIELMAAIVSVTYVFLSIKQIIWLWLFGIMSAILYAWVYAHSGFYAGMALQAYYAFISIYGWVHWSSRSRKKDGSQKGELPVIRLEKKLLITLLVVWLLLWQLIGWILFKFTDSTIPFWDAFTAAGGIVATWMLTRKILEQWIFWIFIDLLSIGLYVWQELYATTVLFVVYVIMAVFGYLQWKKAWKTAV
jgi:nicotinamide mononucleotide transporter